MLDRKLGKYAVWLIMLTALCGFMMFRPDGCRSAAQRKLAHESVGSPAAKASGAAAVPAGNPPSGAVGTPPSGRNFKAMMVSDMGGINDQSFNESAWNGLKRLRDEQNISVGYIESVQEADYFINLDRAADVESDAVWGVGYTMAEHTRRAALMTPDIMYGCIDNAFGENVPDNLFGVTFRVCDAAFMAGYAAALTSETGHLGFIGGIRMKMIEEFEYGWRAGAALAAAESGRHADVSVQYAESFNDAAKGRAIAMSMFSDGCDVIFNAAGGVGIGCIEAAASAGKFAVGVDMDQRFLAPKNVLTSVLKKVDVAVCLLTKRIIDGEKIGGRDYLLGLSEGAVGLPDDNPNMDPEVYKRTLAVGRLIEEGRITAPNTEEEFLAFEADIENIMRRTVGSK